MQSGGGTTEQSPLQHALWPCINQHAPPAAFCRLQESERSLCATLNTMAMRLLDKAEAPPAKGGGSQSRAAGRERSSRQGSCTGMHMWHAQLHPGPKQQATQQLALPARGTWQCTFNIEPSSACFLLFADVAADSDEEGGAGPASPRPAKRARKSRGGFDALAPAALRQQAQQLLEQSFKVAEKGIAGGWCDLTVWCLYY